MSLDPAALLGARRIMVAANGIDFEVYEAGEGERLALLLHGFPQHAIMWRHQIAPLVAKGYRVWAVNQRGYGDTTRPAEVAAYGLATLAQDVAALIDASGATRVSLVAHDWGGFVAWAFAAWRLRPIEKLAFLNIPHPRCFARALKGWRQKTRSAYAAFFQLPRAPEWLLTAGGGVVPAYMFRHSASRVDAIPAEIAEFYCARICAPGAATTMLNWYRAAGDDLFTTQGLSAPVEAPTLIVWGERDIALGVECLTGTERYVADLRVERLPGVSHWVAEDAPERVNALLAAFL